MPGVRLHDLPVASGNFTTGPIVFNNRYIVLVGGYQYNKVLAPDGSVQPLYGTPSQHDPGNYYSDMWVYDTVTNKFGTATPLPLNTNTPITEIDGNTIRLIGGETDGASGFSGTWVNGVAYGHTPDLYLTGTISVVPEPGRSAFWASPCWACSLYGWWKRR